MSETDTAVRIAVAIGLAVLNGLFLMGEAALVSVRRARTERLGRQGVGAEEAARIAARELEAFVAATQAGSALSAIGFGWIGGPALSRIIGPIPAALILFAAYLTIGAFFLRPLALARPDGVARALYGPIIGFYRLATPILWAARGLGRFALRLTGGSSGDREPAAGADEAVVLSALKSYRYGEAGGKQRELLAALFDFSERTLMDVMTPRREMASLATSMKVAQAVEAVRQFGFTRYPVCDGGMDRVVGVVHFRELIDALDTDPKRPITELMSASLVLPGDMPVTEALRAMRERSAHMAIVADEYRKTAGIVTLEDLLDELVGTGPSEASDGASEREKIRDLGGGRYELDASLLVSEVEDAFDIDLHHAGLETIGAYLYGRIGRKPQLGDSIEAGAIVFDVAAIKGNRIVTLHAYRSRKSPPAPDGSDPAQSGDSLPS